MKMTVVVLSGKVCEEGLVMSWNFIQICESLIFGEFFRHVTCAKFASSSEFHMKIFVFLSGSKWKFRFHDRKRIKKRTFSIWNPGKSSWPDKKSKFQFVTGTLSQAIPHITSHWIKLRSSTYIKRYWSEKGA